MRYRRLGRTGLLVSELALGTVELGLAYGIAPASANDPAAGELPPTPAEAIRLIQQALDAGLNFIDTARAYGSSETVIGQALPGRRDQVYLATKVGCTAAEQALTGPALARCIRDSLTTSLAELRTDWVDLLLLHSAPVPVLESGEAMATLQALQAEGLARYIGASTYGLAAARLALEQGQAEVLQVAFNVFDQRLADPIFALAQQQEVGLVIRSVYLKGALTGRAEDLPARLEPLKARSRAFRHFVSRLTPPLTPVAAALRFALSQAEVASVLVGVRSEAELAQALQAAAAGRLDPAVLAELERHRWDDPAWVDPSQWGIP
jgi:aryl-alcohol dehydrogenase-like predicted oxidoreductase